VATDDDLEYEPDADEIEAMRESEQAFREAHDLLDDDAWDAYCDGVGEDWLASQTGVEQAAKEFILAYSRSLVEAREEPAPESAPDPQPEVVNAPDKDRWPYDDLTHIEAPFFDALAETGLTFSVQPWMQHADRKYRADFIVYYDGRAVCVELDGHDTHKTKEQRSYDAKRANWFQSRGIRVVRFTGSQVYADVQGCVRELLDVVRESQARP